LTGLVIAGILAAVMSTADSFLNIGAAALVRDIPRLLLGRTLERELVWGRWATVGVALAAAALALIYGDLIALLGTFAFGILAASLAPTLALGFNWERVSAAAASASIATGLGVTLLLELLQSRLGSVALGTWSLASGALPAAVALAASLTVLLVVSWLTGRNRVARLSADMLAVMEN
jgi:sodium/proline symporter/sodium/pantothenate symporter